MDPNATLPSWAEMYSTGVGLACAGASNFSTGRPILSRLPIFAIYGTLGFMAGHFIEKYAARRHIARDVYMMDYIRTHPEDFPELEKKQYKNVLETWRPFR